MPVEALREHSESLISGMREKRYPWWGHWGTLADFILPRRYRWLVTANDLRRGSPINNNIIDSTGTLAARVLASGMMAGITSPTRPWFKLRIRLFEDNLEVGAWLAECEARMMTVFQESNFYTAMAVMYFDLVVFGSACVLIYEDFDNVIHCFSPCLGEFFFELDSKFQVNTVGREMTMTFSQIQGMFSGNEPDDVKAWMRSPTDGARGTREKLILHLIEPNKDNFDIVPKMFPFREIYWAAGTPRSEVLKVKGFYEWPGMTPRWDVTANDPYGRSPGMDALGDIKQLQQEQRRKAQAIDKMVNPPMLADITLKNQPASGLPGGVTYVANLMNNPGMKPIYQVMPPIGEIKQDIQENQSRIKITFHNDLFTGITDLQTVRTATEIDARREEKLVLLGPVLERILGEGLGKAIDRTWGIMERGRLLPPPPASLGRAPAHVEIDYVSMLALAQRGLATAAIEKLWGFAGSIAGAVPGVLDKLDEDETINEYGDALGVSPKLLRDSKMVAQIREQRQKQQAAAHAAASAPVAAEGAKTLSETDVGGGRNALQVMLGNENV